MNLGLIVVDMQNAFCHPEGSMRRIGLKTQPLRAPIAAIAKLIETARAAKVIVIFTRYVYRSDYADGGILIKELFPQIKEVSGLRAGTWDVEVIDELKPAPGEFVIDKNRYSAFFKTSLEDVLRESVVDTLMIVGVTTSMCVESTARDAHFRDYRVWIVREATAEIDAQRHESALATIEFGFGRVIGCEDACRRILENAATNTNQEAAS